ncbi:hypothetical protein DM860_006320 [Cuscuta australis]|uniref:Uncharacterized protein n=1 Tax=Cuscuta australis TaxID=267555 RepID=A0A328DKZ4_9ASTE|nr:hypothetical protein DM860_006320 [Cuscuta australis]
MFLCKGHPTTERRKLRRPKTSCLIVSSLLRVLPNDENGSSGDGHEKSKVNNSSTDAKGDNKRKQDSTVSDVHLQHIKMGMLMKDDHRQVARQNPRSTPHVKRWVSMSLGH